MQVYRCMNHPGREAIGQCRRCGKPVCAECLNPETGVCRFRCGETYVSAPVPPRTGGGTFLRVVISILAIVGGLALLLVAICGMMIFGGGGY